MAMQGGHIAMESATGNNFEIFCRSLALVGVAELFDKTWFMGLLFALRYGARLVFIGSFAALFLHCFLAAALGLAFARFLSKMVLSYLTAALFFLFAGMYAKDCYYADPEADAIEAGKEEASGEVELEAAGEVVGATIPDSGGEGDEAESLNATKSNASTGTENCEASYDKEDEGAAGQEKGRPPSVVSDWVVLGKSFMGVFIAEWGDRTQIAMIGQHASQPLLPVFFGSALAFFLLTLSAVGAATLLNGQKLREKVVFGFSAMCFLFFGLLALKDAIMTSGDD